MSDSDKTVEYGINANADPFVQQMDKARAAAVQSAKGVEAAFGQLGSVFKALQGSIGAMLGVFAGGAAFASAINTTKEWGAETGKLSKQLQVTTTEATAYQVAAKKLGVDAAVITDASDKMTKQLGKNEEAFATLGLETRNSNGSFRSTGDLLPEVMDKLRSITNVTEQNVAGTKLFGKGWGEVRALMKLSSEEMAEARQKVKDLNLEVDPKAVRKYNEAINDVKLIATSLSVQVGNALLPVLTDLGAWFGQVGPGVVTAFSVALKLVQSIVTSLWGVIKGVVQGLTGVVAAVIEVIQGNYSTAWGILKDAGATAFDSVAQGFDDAAAVWQPKLPKPTIEKGDGGKHIEFGGDGGADKSRVSGWETQLETAKAALERQGMEEGQFRQRSLADNLAFWQQLLQRKDLTEQEKTQISRKAAEAEMAMIRDTFDVQVKALEAESAQYKTNFAEKLRIETEIQAKYAQGTKEFEAAQARINAIKRQSAEQDRAVAQAKVDAQRQASLATIALEEQTLQQAQRLGLVSQEQVLQQQLSFEERRNAIAAAALAERLAMAELDPDRNALLVEQIHAQQEALEQQHQQRIGQIRGNLQAAQLDPIVRTYQAAEQALAGAIQGMINRTMTLGQAMKSIWQGISQSIISEIAKILAKKIAAWAVEKALALAGIGTDAVKAGSGAASAVASIPYVGPVMAIAALDAVMGAVTSAKSNVPSAAMGYDIPAGLNPLTQLHEKEMVLPAKHADVIRSMADGQGPAAGGPPVVFKPTSAGDFLIAHKSEFSKLLRSMKRDFEFQ